MTDQLRRFPPGYVPTTRAGALEFALRRIVCWPTSESDQEGEAEARAMAFQQIAREALGAVCSDCGDPDCCRDNGCQL